jgi:hypothetical protein
VESVFAPIFQADVVANIQERVGLARDEHVDTNASLCGK